MLGLLAGLGGGAGLAAFYGRSSLGTMSIVSPVVACGAVVPFAISLATGERPAALAIAGAVRRARRRGARLGRGAPRARARPRPCDALAVVAAVALGLFTYFLGLGSREGSVLSTLVGARVGSLTLLAAARVRAPRDAAGRPAWLLARVVAVGLLRRRARTRCSPSRAARAARARVGARLALSGDDGAARATRPRRAADAAPARGRRASALAGVAALSAG